MSFHTSKDGPEEKHSDDDAVVEVSEQIRTLSHSGVRSQNQKPCAKPKIYVSKGIPLKSEDVRAKVRLDFACRRSQPYSM